MTVIEVFRSEADEQWYFRIVGANGETIAQSEGYVEKADCLDTVALLTATDAAVEVKVLEPETG